jgi:hypothetical protein
MKVVKKHRTFGTQFLNNSNKYLADMCYSYIIKVKYYICQDKNYIFFDFYPRNTYISSMGMATKIRLLLVKQGNMSEAELARKLGASPANFYQKMKRDNFDERELRKIGEVLGCGLKISFIDEDTGEET